MRHGSAHTGMVIPSVPIGVPSLDSLLISWKRQEFLARALASAHTGAWQMDEVDGETLRNLEHDQIFGYEELLPHWGLETLLAHVVPEEREAVDRQIRQAFETGDRWSVECRIKRLDGAVRWISTTGSRLPEEGGQQPSMAGIVRDITESKQAEEELLRACERPFLHALENTSEGYAILSPDWTYLFVNKANAEQAHTRTEEMVGRNMLEVIPGSEKSPFFEAYRRCMDERTTQRVESAFTYEDGSSAWFEAVAEPVPEGILVRARDITERKLDEHSLRESEELVRTIAENSTQALVMMDASGYCTYWNPALVAMTGYTAEDLQSRPLHELVHHHHPNGLPYPAAECPIDRALAERSDVRAHEDLFFRKDGTTFPVLCAASPIVKAGKSVGTVVEVRDVTELHQAEEALVEANRRKDHFLAILSHELRNPLVPIRNGLYILDRAPAGGEQAGRAKAMIQRQVDQLLHLVDDLLDVSRIARGKVQLQRQRLELNELVSQTLEDHRSLFEEAELDLEVEAFPQQVFVDADWNRIVQVLGNLLLNAVKFTPPGGRVTVALSVDASARQAVLRLSDTGAGIAPNLLPELFDPFTQAEGTLDRSNGGLGLGLALVKGLIEQHGGSVTAASRGEGRGAEFTVRLPLDMAAHPRGDLPAVRKLQRRVLIIEDNKDAADSLQEMLAMNGHEVIVAYSGPEGLAKAREFDPDVVFCDIGMPRMNGYAVARRFRADEKLKHVHLVALTGYASPEDLRHAVEAGFDRHIAKPPPLEKIEKLLRAAR
jgi:PAS domain S-box-containing protein